MLTGKHIVLRAIESEDLPQLLAWRNQPHFRRFFREHRELSMTNQMQWYENMVVSDPRIRMFSIVTADEGVLLGATGLCYIDTINRNADFSIYIGYKDLYIDHHYSPDVAHVLLKYGFEELNLHRVWAEIYSIDTKKIQFFSELGFIQEGCHRQHHWTEGRWVDSLFFGLLKEEFYVIEKR